MFLLILLLVFAPSLAVALAGNPSIKNDAHVNRTTDFNVDNIGRARRSLDSDKPHNRKPGVPARSLTSLAELFLSYARLKS